MVVESIQRTALVFDHPRARWPDPQTPPRSVDIVTIERFLEYLPGQQRIVFFNHLDKLLSPGAKVHVAVPYYSHPQAMADWGLCWPPLSEHSWLFLDRAWREMDGHEYTADLGYTSDLVLHQYEYEMVDSWTTRHDNARAFGVQHYLGVVTRVIVTLIKPDEDLHATRFPETDTRD